MIICHPLKVIFIKTLKVGGTSFEIALSKYCGDECIVTPISPRDEALRSELGFKGMRNFNLEDEPVKAHPGLLQRGFSGSFYNHMTSEEVFRQIPPDIWNGYLKIAIQRNPFDVLVSEYFFQKLRREKQKKRRQISFSDWCKKKQQVLNENMAIAPISDPYKVDKSIRYVDLEDDVNGLNVPGLWEVFKSIRAKGDIRPAKNTSVAEMFKGEAEMISTICELCAEEIAYFNYEIPQP